MPIIKKAAAPKTVEALDLYESREIGFPKQGQPWITHVIAVDLDQDGLLDILSTDSKINAVTWLRQSDDFVFEESILADNLAAPVHVEYEDMDFDGDLDLLVSCMGQVFPNNDKIGSVYILENDGSERFTPHLIIDRIARVCDVRAGDFDEDGRLDLAVAEFGYDQGEIRWMRNLGGWKFESHILQSLSGPINVCLADMNGDRTLDIVALVSQEWEEIYLFENKRNGVFTPKVIFGSTNEDYGSSNILLSDINRDGKLDIVYTNGDGFDYASPGPRPWHGTQWLENRGNGYFQFHRLGDMAGAYGPSCADMNGDGAMDIIVVSCFNEWDKPDAVSMILYENDGNLNFYPKILARKPTHLLSTAVADFNGDGIPEIVTGGFHAYPPYSAMSRIRLWTRKK